MAGSKTKTRKAPRLPVAQEPEKDRSQYFSRAVGKSLEVLEILQSEPAPLPLNDISRRLKLSKTSAFRLLCTLETAGYVVQNDNARYLLTPEIHRAVSSRFLLRLLQAASPVMRDLCRGLRETVSVAALFENRVEVIAVEESPELIRMSNSVGQILPPNASALAKAIAASQTRERREKLIRSFGFYRYTPNTIADPNALDDEFDRIRVQGHAADMEESVADGCAFAVPLPGANGEVQAAIGIAMPKSRLRDAELEARIIDRLKRAAEELATALRNL